MGKANFLQLLQREVERLDAASAAKRHEKVISGFTQTTPPQAVIDGRPVTIFNSNDYLGLRLSPALRQAEAKASEQYGTGPGAVRFISGSLQIHLELEKALAAFHHREAAMVFSSAFATNLAVIMSLIKGQAKDSLVSADTLVLSDELNHRSIIEGVRVANLDSEHRAVYKHLDYVHLEQLLKENAGKFSRCLILTDGVFSMLGEVVDLAAIRMLADQYDGQYTEGVLVFVDDCHGIGVLGDTGRGTEEVCQTQADILVGTMGKAFGVDGGYVVGSQQLIEYLREACATYIYSNPISPGTAGAALAAVQLVDSPEGTILVRKLHQLIAYFKGKAGAAGLPFAASSTHAIQPVLVGESAKSKRMAQALFEAGILVTTINYPVVASGRDEIRIQINATHTEEQIEALVSELKKAATA